MTDRFVSTSVWKLENGISDQKPAWKQGPGEALSCRKQPDPSPPSSAKSQSTKDDVPSVTLKSYTTKDTDSYHDSSCSNSLKYKSMEKNLNFSSELSNPKIEALYSDCEVGEKEERSGGISKKELNGLVRKGGEVGLPALPINLAESGFGYKYGFGEGGVGGGSVVESSSGKPFRWAEIGVKRLLFFLGKNVPNYQLIFLIIPILLAMLSLFGPIYYYKNISYSVPFPAFMNPNEKSSNSEHYKIGSSSLQNFNSTNAMFGSIKKTLQSEFSVIMSMPNHYDNVINEDVVGYYQELRSTLQSLKFTRAKETKFKWADVCKEDCGEKNALIEKLIDKEMLLRYPEGVMKESFNQSINISKHFIGNILGDIVQDSEGIVSRARSLQLIMKMKDNLKNEIFEEYEKNFRIQMKFEAVAAESQGLELTFWSVRKYVDEVLQVIQAIHKNILYCAILLVVLCFIGGMKGDGYQSRPFFGIQIAVVILIAIICGVFVHIAGASQYYSFAFIVAFPIIQISILYFFSMMDTWSRYSMAALHPIEKLVFIVSWDGPAMVISFFIFVVATLVAAVFATNHHLQYSMIIGGGSFATLMTFSLSFLMVCMYRSGKAESSGIKWYHFCKNGDQNFNEKTLPDFDVNFFNILHEKLTDYRSTLSRKVGTFIANTNIRFLIVFTFAIYIVVGFFFAYQGTVNLKEEHFVSSNTTSAKYLAAYQNGFKKSDNFLEINFNAPLDYYDRVKKDEILSLLRWPLEQQYATKAISWLMDFDRFQHSTIYDVNADTIVPVVTLIFLKSPQFSRYSSDIVLDKFGTQIVKTRMYLELSTKGFSDQLSMIRGIKDLAKKYDLPITLKTPFIFSLDHDLQLFNCCLQAVLAICVVIVVLSLILFNNPAMSTIILVCNFIFVVIGVGYSHLCGIPLNIVTATGIIFGMIFNSAVSIHFSYNYSNSGSSQVSSTAKLQYAFQCTFVPTCLACIITSITYMPLLLVKAPVLFDIWCIILLTSLISFLNLVLLTPLLIVFLTETVAMCFVNFGKICEEPSINTCIVEQPGDGIYYLSQSMEGRGITFYNRNMIQGFQPPRQMIMPPPPDYDKSATSRRTKRVPSSSRRAGAFNDSYEHDESIYEEPQTPPLPKKHPKQTPAPRKHIETLSKQAESITPNQSRRDYRYNYPPTTQPHPQTSAMRQAGFVDSSNPGMNAQMNAWRAINYGYPPQQHPNTQFQFTSPPSGQRRFY